VPQFTLHNCNLRCCLTLAKRSLGGISHNWTQLHLNDTMLLLYFMRSYLLLRMPQLLKFYLVQYFCIILNILKLEL